MRQIALVGLALVCFSCLKEESDPIPLENTVNEDIASYQEIGSIGLGGLGAAEITAFDPATKQLFAVNNSATANKIDVIDLSNPAAPTLLKSIPLATYGGYVNSVDVYDGKLAAAIESINKQQNGKVVVFNTTTLAEVKVIEVGALPDMVTYTKDGKYILTANEGEPNDAYTTDPEGTVSIIKVADYSVKTLNFAAFESQLAALTAKGFRIYGPGKNFLKDIEPEYIAISDDSKTAWVTLQENNAIAELDIVGGVFKKITPLGFKNYGSAGNEIDPSDKDTKVEFRLAENVFGMYQPDAITQYTYNGIPYLFTANEGDAREYTGFTEMRRVGASAHVLDATKFPNASTLKTDAQLGRLNTTTTLGDTDGDGDFDAIYTLGARSFSVWNGLTGDQVFDSKNELDKKALELLVYDDGRSDDKGTEPEAVTVGKVGSKQIAIVGLERADAFAIYDITIPTAPVFVKLIKTGDAPEGVLFIPAGKSPIQQSLIVVSSENDGFVKIYKATKL